jgi:hypothetical protein
MYKKLTKEELDKTLKEHTKWLENPSAGKKADLSSANLSNANLLNNSFSKTFTIKSEYKLSNADIRKLETVIKEQVDKLMMKKKIIKLNDILNKGD